MVIKFNLTGKNKLSYKTAKNRLELIMKYKIKRVFIKSIMVMSALLTGYIFYYSLFSLNASASFIKENSSNISLILLFGSLLLFSFLFIIFKYINILKYKYIPIVIISCCVFILIFQLIIICNFNVAPITDSYMVCDHALMLASGKINSIDSDIPYFAKYGNNYFVTILLSGVFSIFSQLNIENFTVAMSLFNTLFIDLALFFSFMTVFKLYGIRKACKFLIFSAMTPMLYVLIPWSYTCTFSMPFLMGILYFGISLKDEARTGHIFFKSLMIGFLSVVGFFIRPTSAIALIALAICFLIHLISDTSNFKRSSLMLISVILCSAFIFLGCKILLNKFTEDNSQTFPPTHWIMMGLHGDGSFSSEDETYTAGFLSREEKINANLSEIKATIKDYGIPGLLEHFGKKLRVTWTDGTYGYNTRVMQNTQYTPLYKYLAHGKTDFFVLYCQIFAAASYFCCIYSIIYALKKYRIQKLFLIILTLFGGICFYILWESKNAYAIPFLPLIYILACDGIDSILETDIKYKFTAARSFTRIMPFCICVTILTMIIKYPVYTKETKTHIEPVIYSYTTQLLRYEETAGDLVQEFYANGAFNTITIKCKASDGTSTYNIYLEESGRTVYSEEISDSDITRDGFIKLSFPRIEPEGVQKYILKIIANSESGSISWGHRYADAIDNYKGTCYLDNLKKTYDLYLQVYDQYSAPYISSFNYMIICAVLIFIEIFIFLCLNRIIAIGPELIVRPE